MTRSTPGNATPPAQLAVGAGLAVLQAHNLHCCFCPDGALPARCLPCLLQVRSCLAYQVGTPSQRGYAAANRSIGLGVE